MIGLTQRQADLYDYLTSHRDFMGVMPSFDEMRDAMGLASKSGIFRLLEALEEKGLIRRIRHRARAIEILPDPSEPLATHRHLQKTGLEPWQALEALGRYVEDATWDDVFECLEQKWRAMNEDASVTSNTVDASGEETKRGD